MKITQKDVAYVANLANLDLTDAERLRMEKDLNRILEYVDQLAEVDTDKVLPMAQVSQIGTGQTGIFDPLRADEPRECLSHEAAMASAPQSDGTFFRVPKVIER
ncbi:MAG: Asp-tRNA(Asn)/Glu-tRNA(Gln) amidotransferase GatCAB subunit C [Acidobacteria bacterium]|nr:MAG: Asp-tRNA(Asn)/Glu-tRNA(Gln) amidotransferase GatCAB subunit C [Acidobacteriota bacterium]PYY19568.1 MAG: Asp-tRNA(Asn)/Glu-tRNA(Gln) amidotransferase GatCAB subunit C [Acidobacteriota bacterium]